MTKETIKQEIREALNESTVQAIVDKLDDIHHWVQNFTGHQTLLPDLYEMVKTMSTAQAMMARSAESMAETHRKAEERYAKLEERYETLAVEASGRDHIPIKSHNRILFVALMPTVLMAIIMVIVVLYYTQTDIKASLSSLEVNQKRTQELVSGKAGEILSNEK